MAIAFDASSGSTGSTISSKTTAHTCTGSNLILFAFVAVYEGGGASDQLTGVTYNGVAMTQVNKYTGAGSGPTTVYLYSLINPATGTNNIVATCGKVVVGIDLMGQSYTGAKQSGVPDAQNTGDTGASPLTISVTTVADNCWLVGGWISSDGSLISAGTATTLRASARNGAKMGDSNGAKTPAGSYSLQASSGSSYPIGCVASFAPFVATPSSGNFFMVM